jgi:hypothetical protein
MEGARRIKRVGLIVMVVGSFVAVILWIIALLWQMGPPNNSPFRLGAVLASLLFALFVPLFFGGALWTLGWILEGFLRPSGKDKMAKPQPIAGNTAFRR